MQSRRNVCGRGGLSSHLSRGAFSVFLDTRASRTEDRRHTSQSHRRDSSTNEAMDPTAMGPHYQGSSEGLRNQGGSRCVPRLPEGLLVLTDTRSLSLDAAVPSASSLLSPKTSTEDSQPRLPSTDSPESFVRPFTPHPCKVGSAPL